MAAKKGDVGYERAEIQRTAEWFAAELADRLDVCREIWVTLEDAIVDGMLTMAAAQAIALSLHTRELATFLGRRPSSIVDVQAF